MTIVVDILRFITLFGSGIAAGALWTVFAVVLPIARRNQPATELMVRQNIDPLMDRFNPILVMLSALAGIVILILHHDLSRASGVLTALGVLGMLGVIATSLGINAPIAKRFHDLSPDSIPAEYPSLVSRWETVHTARTLLAVGALAAYIIAVLSS